MGTFKSEREFNIAVTDLTPVVDDIKEHFEVKGFEVASEQTLTGGWDISVTKGGVFKTILGLKTALKIELESMNGKTIAKAGVGIFGQQAIPSAITLLVFWPVLITQIWGVVEQSKLDEEAMSVIHNSLQYHGRETDDLAGPDRAAGKAQAAHAYCTDCGGSLPASANFCPACGKRLA